MITAPLHARPFAFSLSLARESNQSQSPEGRSSSSPSSQMAVSFITRLLTLALGYAYPAYDCYKTLERNVPQMEHLRFWCQYWILLAFLTAFERVADSAVSWLPMYGEAKLALVVYLWHPKTMGAMHVYDGYLRPYLAAHEADIDAGLLELRTRAKDATAAHLHTAEAFAQTWFVEIARRVSTKMQDAGDPAGHQTR
ncbi:hypothetical protein ACP70R_044905 [Stipagrostis hirtigluma subsp. patula]